VALLPMIGEALEGNAEHAKAKELYERAIEAAGAGRDRRVEAYSRVRRAGVRFLIEPEADAGDLTAEAEAAIETLEREGDDLGLAEAWRLIGEVRVSQGRAEEGRQAFEQALAHIDRELAPRAWNAVLCEFGMALVDGPSPLEEAAAFGREQLAIARAEELRGVEADMLHVLGAALGRSGDFDAGRAALAESSRISDELGLRYMAHWSKRSLGHLELAAGDPAAAERALRECWDLLLEMGLDSSLGETAVPLAAALQAQGRNQEASEALQAVKDEWASGDATIAAPRLAVRARLQAADGFTTTAVQTADRALRLVRRTDLLCLQADTLLAHAEVARLAGDYDAALGSTLEAERISDAKGYAVGIERARAEAIQIGAPVHHERRGT
jgi:tetratricopeptide (TPR) repeat protein